MDGKDNKEDQSQPTIYEDNEKDRAKLIEWLKWDLYQQRLNIITTQNKTYSSFHFNYDFDCENNFLKTIIDDKELTLNIGSVNINIQLNDRI